MGELGAGGGLLPSGCVVTCGDIDGGGLTGWRLFRGPGLVIVWCHVDSELPWRKLIPGCHHIVTWRRLVGRARHVGGLGWHVGPRGRLVVIIAIAVVGIGERGLRHGQQRARIDVSLYGPIDISHGNTRWVFGYFSPADPGPGNSWTRVWAITAATGAGCLVADVSIAPHGEGDTYSWIDVTAPAAVSKRACVYTLRLTVHGTAFAETQVRVVNGAPTIAVDNAVFNGTSWELWLPAGSTNVDISATAYDNDGDTPLTIIWDGADKSHLTCTPSMCSADVTAPFT